MQERIRCVIMRGGTSRGLFFHRADLPGDEESWTQMFCTAMGTPDPKQVDGLGGGTSSTSKAAVISKSNRPGIDVDYTFIQVGVDRAIADMGGNCGNLSAAVGPFAIDEGLVPAVEPYTEVNIFNTNTGKRLRAMVKVREGKFDPDGNYAMPGLVQKGSEIVMDYFEPEGAMTGKLFPTGNPVDTLQLGETEYPVTIIDCTNPYVFVLSKDLGMTGSELPAQIDDSVNPRILQAIRDLAAEKIGLSGPAFPKVAVVAGVFGYRTVKGEYVEAGAVDLTARTISLGKTHKTIPLTGAFSLAAAAVVPGTLPAGLLGKELGDPTREIRIGHPEGSVTVWVETQQAAEGGVRVNRVTGIRTARRIMEGYVYV